MTDHQPYVPPGSEDEFGTPAGRRRFSYWLIGCMVLFILAVAAAALTLILVNRNGDEPAVAQEAGEQLVETGQPADRPADDTSGTATQDAPESSPTLEATETPELEALSSAEPMATESSATATAVPQATEESSDRPSAREDMPALGEGRIAIVDNRARLWTVAADGSDRRLLTESGRFYQFPSWSPTGNDIAVIGTDFQGGGVYVVPDEEEGEISQLYADADQLPIYLYWSPEGNSVSFIASHPEGLALHLAPKDGATLPEVVATSPSTFFWDWMPDGSQVLIHTGFTALSRDDSRLAFVPLDQERETTEITQHGSFQAPAVAHDGRFYSYSDEDPTGRRWLSVWDLDRGQQVELVFHQGVVAMGFSPTRAQLAFTSPTVPAQSFYGPLRLLDLESGGSQILVPEIVLAYFWSPDGRSIAYLTLTEIDGPLDFDDAPTALLGGPSSEQLAMQGQRPWTKALAKLQRPPDDNARLGLALSVIDVDSGDSRLLTVFEPSDLFLAQFLPFFDQYALSHRLWSPDSQALVVPMRDEDGRDSIVVVPVDGSEPVTISRGVAAFWSHQ